MTIYVSVGDIIRNNYEPNPIIDDLLESGPDEEQYNSLTWNTAVCPKPTLEHLQSLREITELKVAKKIKWRDIVTLRKQKIDVSDDGTKTGDEMEAYGKSCYDYAVTLNTSMQALTTIAEIEAFDITTGWPV